MGVLGDSYSDEYQFYAPHRSSARNWVEILAARGVNFGDFQDSSRGEPRNQGFAYNWARSGATSADMIASGQHTGLASQVASGQVSAVVIFVGGNDFIDALHAPNPEASLKGSGIRALDNVRLAVETLRAASTSVKIMVATVPDLRDLPEFRQALRSKTLPLSLADLASAEVETFNAEVRRLAARDSGLWVFDFASISRLSRLMYPKFITVAGRRVEREKSGDTPDSLFLADERHLGTIGQGMLAKFMVDALNRGCKQTLPPLREDEIVSLADAVGPGSPSGLASGRPPVSSGNP